MDLDVSFSTSSEEEERQVLGLLMNPTGELLPRGERMWFLLSGMEGGEWKHPKVLCCAPAWIFRWWLPWTAFSHGIMDSRTVRPGWLQNWLFSLCLVPSSVTSKHNVGIPKIGNTQPMTFTLWMNLERHPRKQKEKKYLPFFYSQARGFSLAVIPEEYLELRGNQKH